MEIYCDRRKSEFGTLLWLQGFFIVQSTKNNTYTIHAFEQFWALYMHNTDEKHSTRPWFEPITSAFRATTGPNEQCDNVTQIIG